MEVRLSFPFVCVLYVCMYARSESVEVRGLPAGVHYLFLAWGLQGPNSGCQAWHQAPLLAGPSSHPQVVFVHSSWLTIFSLKQATEARTPLTQHGSENPNLFQTFCSRVHHKQILFMEPAIRTELNEMKHSWYWLLTQWGEVYLNHSVCVCALAQRPVEGTGHLCLISLRQGLSLNPELG